MTADWRRGLRLLGRAALLVFRAILGLAWVAIGIVARLPIRAQVAVVLATLVVAAGMTASVAPSLSEVFNGVAVLFIAAGGLWLIVMRAFVPRRR